MRAGNFKKTIQAVAIALASFLAGGASAADKPNVIVIVADDAGYADFGFSDGISGTTSQIPTPNLDALAARGVRFSRAYVAQSCQPTRAALVTGGYQNRIGNEVVGDNIQGLPASATTIFDRMQSVDYTTSAVGKWHLGSVAGPQGNRPETQGVDEFYGIWHGSRTYALGNAGLPQTQLLRESIVAGDGSFTDTVVESAHSGEYITNTFGQYGIDFIADHHNDADPFFLYQSFTAPHTPLQNSPDFNDPRLAGLSGTRKTYGSMMLTMDKEIGRILDRLEDPDGNGNTSDSIADNTMIVFVNDNGGADAGSSSPNGADNGHFRAGKGTPYEGGIRVPMIIAGAGVNASAQGTTYNKPVHGVDILPTAFATGGGSLGPADPGIDGVNLLPFINGTDTSDPHEVLVNRHRKQFTVIKGDWTFVNAGGSSTSSHRLYNLATDIGQQTNVAGANPEVVAELTRVLTDHEAEFDKQRHAILGRTAEATINLFDHFKFRPTPGGGIGEVVIIEGSTGNGDFEDSEPASGPINYENTMNWFNAGGAETINFTNDSQTGGSSQSGSRAGMPFQNRTQVNNTGHTITAAGEVFDLSYDFGAGGALANWTGDETMSLFLFTASTTVDGNITTSSITELVSDDYSIDRAGDGQWTTRTSDGFYTSTAADIGKEVFLGMVFDDPSGPLLFPRIDVIRLAATGSGGPAVATTNWSQGGAWFEAGTSAVETMFNSDAFAGAVLEFGTSDTFSYISNNDMVRETGLEFMLNKIILGGTFNGTQNHSATIEGNDLLFTKSLDGTGPQITVDASGGGANSFSFSIDLNLIMHADLEITGDGDSEVTVNGVVSDYFAPRNLTKSGSSSVVLTGENTYQGDTSVEGGTLSITTAYLEDDADVYLTTGAVFDLDFNGQDTIDSLFIDGVSQATGTWGALNSGAMNESALFTGSGLLLVSTLAGLSGDYNNDGVVDAADYTVWRDNLGAAAGTLPNDVDGGQIGSAQYQTWKANYGTTLGAGSAGSIPEPGTAFLIAIALAMHFGARR